MTEARTSKLFRQESLDRVSSPEQLDEYIRVSNPSVWMILALIVLLLAAGLIWACVGHLTESLSTTLVVQDGQAVCYVPESAASQLGQGQRVTADGAAGTVAAIQQPPVSPDNIASRYDEYTAYKVNAAEWSNVVQVDINLPDGLYSATISTDEFAPLALLFGGAA